MGQRPSNDEACYYTVLHDAPRVPKQDLAVNSLNYCKMWDIGGAINTVGGRSIGAFKVEIIC